MAKMKKVSEYQQRALDFCTKNGVVIEIKHGNFTPITNGRPYDVTIWRGNKKMTVQFSDSQYNKEKHIKPDEYSILACLQKYDVGSFEDFCADFGYIHICSECGALNQDSYKTYKAVYKEYKDVMRIFGDVIEEMQEIQ